MEFCAESTWYFKNFFENHENDYACFSLFPGISELNVKLNFMSYEYSCNLIFPDLDILFVILFWPW